MVSYASTFLCSTTIVMKQMIVVSIILEKQHLRFVGKEEHGYQETS